MRLYAFVGLITLGLSPGLSSASWDLDGAAQLSGFALCTNSTVVPFVGGTNIEAAAEAFAPVVTACRGNPDQYFEVSTVHAPSEQTLYWEVRASYDLMHIDGHTVAANNGSARFRFFKADVSGCEHGFDESVGCEEPPPGCDEGVSRSFTVPGDSYASTLCKDGCQWQVHGMSMYFEQLDLWSGDYYPTGEFCVAGAPVAPASFDPDVAPGPFEGETCVGDWCSQTGGNCGYLNDLWICPKTVSPDNCQANPDGSRTCGASANTPPAPDSGTPGVKANPDWEALFVDHGDGTSTPVESSVDWYSDTTVAGSSRNPGPGDGSGPDTGQGNDTSEGDGEGGDCSLLPQFVCDWFQDTDDFPDGPDESEFMEELDVSENTWTSGLSSGSCPAARNFSLAGQNLSFTYDTACDVAAWFRAILLLSVSFLAGSIILGVRA